MFTLWALLTNRFFASTVRIQSEHGHHVIDSGPYRLVRHPGYTGAGIFSALSPIALGSWLALWAAAFILIVLIVRTSLEDRTLQAELPG
jgi:protein-S-isoprenylcysteine O-methyltransferase Ste14